MKIEQRSVGPAASNCYILVNEDLKQAVVIDPGDDADVILALLDQLDVTVVAYPLTHGHVDHVSALAAVHRQHPAPIALHAADQGWAFDALNQMPPYYDAPEDPGPIERELAEGQEWTDAGFRYQVLHTPGHTPGGVCFLFPDHDLLIAGDTLFQGSIGRTDLPGGDMDVLQQSLVRLKTLPDELRVLPGHGPATTIGTERATNPFLLAL